MKLKKLLKIGLPIVGMPLLAMPVVACSPTKETGIEITHADGTSSHYNTMEEALKDVRSGDTLTLQSDVKLSDTIDFKTLNGVTIDGNGYVITNTKLTNAVALFSFENCTNITLANFTLSGKADVGIYAKNGFITLQNVNSFGEFKNVIYLDGEAGANINGCILNTQLNPAIYHTIYIKNQSGDCVTLENTYADNIYIENNGEEYLASTRIVFKSNVYMRFVAFETQIYNTELNTYIKGYKNVSDLLFVGYFDYLYDCYRSLTSSANSFFVFDGYGLNGFAYWYRNLAPEYGEMGIHTELHLLCDIDFNPEENGYWTPLNTGKRWTTRDDETDLSYGITLIDGHGYTISNLQINQESAIAGQHAVGFLGYVGNTTTKNITFDNCRLEMDKGPNSLQNAGMIYGVVTGKATLSHVTVSNSYIGAKQKVGSLVGIIDSGYRGQDTESTTTLASLNISACTSNNCSVVNKSTGSGEDVDVYLGGLVGWLAYHCNLSSITPYDAGILSIDADITRPTNVIDLHFNWQQESEAWDTNFEIAILFLYSHDPYRHCNSFENVYVRYTGE